MSEQSRFKQNETSASVAAVKPERLWSPLFVFIFFVALGCFTVGMGLNSGTSVFLDRMGEGAVLAGIYATVFSAAAGVTRFVVGPAIDRRGRRIIMIVGTFLLLVGTVVPALTTNTVVFAICRGVQGIGFSAATTASSTAAADVLPESRLGEGLGYYGLGQALAMSIGPALALFLVALDPAQLLYGGLTAIAVFALLSAFICTYEKNPLKLPKSSAYRVRYEADLAKQEQRDVASDDAAAATAKPANQNYVTQNAHSRKPLSITERLARFGSSIFEKGALSGSLVYLIISPAFGFGLYFMGLYGTSLGVGNAGLFYTVAAVSMVAIRLTSGAFMDHVASIKIMAVCAACGVLAYVLAFCAPANNLLFYAAGLPYGVCMGISIPLNQSVAVRNTPQERWGAANAMYLLANDIGIGIASIVWGIFSDTIGFSATLVCCIACIAASFVVAWITYPVSERRDRPRPQK